MFDRYVDFSEQFDNNAWQGFCGVAVSWTCEHHGLRRAETIGGPGNRGFILALDGLKLGSV